MERLVQVWLRLLYPFRYPQPGLPDGARTRHACSWERYDADRAWTAWRAASAPWRRRLVSRYSDDAGACGG